MWKLIDDWLAGDHPLSPLLVIVGTTAVGKTVTCLQAAQRYDGEIVMADSRAVYRGMDIGTAKPTDAEQQVAPHHLIDVCDPDHDFTLAEYQQLAFDTIDDIIARGKLPILSGSAGLYVESVIRNYQIPPTVSDPDLRAELKRLSETELRQRLAKLDPDKERSILPHNLRYLIRAIEIASNKNSSSLGPPRYDYLLLGLRRPRQEIYDRIDQRVDQMIETGLVEEVSELLTKYPQRPRAFDSLGYQELIPYLEDQISLEEAITQIKTSTRHYAKRQLSWWRRASDITWFDI